MAAVAVYAAERVAAPLHRVAPSATPRATSHPRAALRLGVADDLALRAAPHGARKGRHPVGSARNPHFCREGAALKGYTDGPAAWVQGRRATSKVTATSGGRLTNRYAWVPGRPTGRACLGVNLPLRVPPCKHYPEDVTEFKMAALILLRYRQRRLLRRNRIFRDRTNPLHKFNDLELFWKFRFRRAGKMTNELKEELEHLNRKGALPPVFTGRRTALNPCQQ